VSLRGFFASEKVSGNKPDKCPVALLLIDVINDLEFSGGEEFLPQALRMARSLARLTKRARRNGVPVVYANDNLCPDFSGLVKHCIMDGVRGEAVTTMLRPTRDDYIVLKHKHSGFFSTTLDTLLRYLGTNTLIITGMATDKCVHLTAKDAYIRDFRIFVPADCVAAENKMVSAEALSEMERVLKVDVRPSRAIDFRQLLDPSDDPLDLH
jgi:nicotinamidase-related amidase